MLDWMCRLFEEHHFMRRFVLFWAMALITVLSIYLFIVRGGMTDAEARALLGIIGMFATAVGLYTWQRSK